MRRIALLLALCLWVGHCCEEASAAQWRVGTSRTNVTPEQRLPMSGYAARKHPAEGTVHALWAKALVIEDAHAQRVVIVTADLIGDEFGRELADNVAVRVHRRTGIGRERIILNASHTHCGPVTSVTDGALVTYSLSPQQQAAVSAYGKRLEDKLVEVIVAASGKMVPAELSYAVGKATFGANRRLKLNPNGLVDHSVPVLRIRDENERLLVVLFGYACHATTLGGDFYRYNGDYAGYAQIALEQAHPGSTAMFLAGCGADINPSPRGTLELAKEHGKALGGAVEQVLDDEFQTVHSPLAVAFERVDLPFVDPPTKTDLEQRRGEGNVYQQRLSEVLLQRLERQGNLETAYPCPIHVVKFGNDLSVVALGGEVVVDYALRLQREFAGQKIWVAGYCDEVLAYIPSERVLSEGGYEGGGAMQYFAWHGPFQPGVEQRVVTVVKRLMKH